MKLGVMLLLQRRIQAPAVMVTNLTEREAIVARLITVKMVTALNVPDIKNKMTNINKIKKAENNKKNIK